MALDSELPASMCTLSSRGSELAGGPSIYDTFKKINTLPYDAVSNPTGTINIGIAENTTMLEDVADFLTKNFRLAPDDIGYGEGPWGSLRLRKAMASFMNHHFKVLEPVDPEHLVFANGVTSCCESLAFCLGDAGDGILQTSPSYQAFPLDFGQRAKVECVFTKFGPVDQFSPDAVPCYERALLEARKDGIRVTSLLLCNPHNPLGQPYPKETIIAIMKFCNHHNIHLISDEIYATTVYDIPETDAIPFTSVLSFDSSAYINPDLLHVLYGMSKHFAANGMRIGCAYTKNEALLRGLRAFTQFHWPSGPSQHMFTLMLEDTAWMNNFIVTSRQRLAARNKLTREILDAAGIKYHRGSNAGFFLMIDLRPFIPPAYTKGPNWQGEEVLKHNFAQNNVFVTPGRALSAEEPGWFRVIFSHDERKLREGLRRVLEVLGKS